MPVIALGTAGGLTARSCGALFDGSNATRNKSSCVHRIVDAAIGQWFENGGRHIDTAFNYGNQLALGAALVKHSLPRHEIFVTSKCPLSTGYDAILRCFDGSIAQLGREYMQDYVDLLLIHYPRIGDETLRWWTDPGREARLASWRAMMHLQATGRVRAIGVSNYRVEELVEITSSGTESLPAVNQVHWSPAYHNETLWRFCEANNIKLMAYSPLGGWRDDGDSIAAHPVVRKIAASRHSAPHQITLQWSLQRGVAIVVSTTSSSHMAANLNATRFAVLAPGDMGAIGSLSASGLDGKRPWEW